MKSSLALLLALALGPARAFAIEPTPPPPDFAAPPAPQGPTPPSDPWLAPPGIRTQANPESQAAAVAAEKGLPPGAASAMMQFFRPRRIAVLSYGGGPDYVFTLGDVERVVSESAFLDSFAALTGSTKLDRFRDPRARSVAGPLLAGGGAAVAYVAGTLALGCAVGDRPVVVDAGTGNQTSARPCHGAISAGIAVGGLAAAVVGLMMIFKAHGEADDPQRHRIPVEQAQEIVREYNRALLEHAAALYRAGDLRSLFSLPAPQRRGPARARWGVGPLGLALRF